jgi:hypothetical protein
MIYKTDLEVRQSISKAEVARYSFKQKAIEDVEVLKVHLCAFTALTPTEAIFLSYQRAIESMGKCLQVFAENQQYLRYFYPLS